MHLVTLDIVDDIHILILLVLNQKTVLANIPPKPNRFPLPARFPYLLSEVCGETRIPVFYGTLTIVTVLCRNETIRIIVVSVK